MEKKKKTKSRRKIMTPEKCQSELNDVLRNNPTITFLLDKIESSGCAIDRSKFFKIEKCSKQVCGGFVPEKGVSVCHNHIQTRTEMENLLAHELIHAYDDCTRRKMDWMDVRHHACSEVRAANLSGDCHWCVRCCWCWCCCWLLRFCENALVLANSFFTFDETFVIF